MITGIYPSYIAGEWKFQSSSTIVELRNPAYFEQVIGRAEFANPLLASTGMDAAQDAWNDWRSRATKERISLLKQLLSRLIERRHEIAQTITSENGKTLTESHAEIDSALKESQYQLQFLVESTIEQVNNHEIRYEPLGVALLITPWNFPLATILRKLIPAIAVGNTVVVKASELTPMTAVALFQIIHEIGFPSGVLNLVIGEGPFVGPTLIQHPALRAISFTGSTDTGLSISKQIAGRNIRLQAEMGGKNTVVVLADANLKDVASAVISNGFACCGQWCIGTSRVIVEHTVYDHFLDLLKDRATDIVVGNGMNKATTMGPVISETHLAKIESAVARSKENGAKLFLGGKRPAGSPGLEKGYFYEPTIFIDVQPDSHLAQNEIFGPVIAVLQAQNPSEALQLTNNSRYGLSFSIYTEDSEKAEYFMQEVQAGLCHINLPTGYRDLAMPLLGWRDSGRGIPESGRFARDFFTRTKAIYRTK